MTEGEKEIMEEKGEKYLTNLTSYPLSDLNGIIDSYKTRLSNNPNIYKDVLTYFNELNFRSGFTLYEQNKEVYLNLLKGFNEEIIKTEAFHDAFFAFNCMEFGTLIGQYYENKIPKQYETIIKDLKVDLEKHQTFFNRCEMLVKEKEYFKYYVIGIKRLSSLIKITKTSQNFYSIDNYLRQFNFYFNLNDKIDMGDFLKKIDVAIFMPNCLENNLKITFDEIYKVYHQYQSNEELLLYTLKKGEKLSKYDLSDKRPYEKIPVDEIRISTKDILKRKKRK